MPSCIQHNFGKVDFIALKTMAWRSDKEQGIREGAEVMRDTDQVSGAEYADRVPRTTKGLASA